MDRTRYFALALAGIALPVLTAGSIPLHAQQVVSPPGLNHPHSEQLDAGGLKPISSNAQPIDPRLIHLDALVTDKQGKPVTNLTAQDFTVLDAGHPVTLTDFGADGAKADAVSAVLIVFDTVNSSLADTAYARDQVMDYLKSDGGKLHHPVALFMFNGDGAVPIGKVSNDGNALAAALQAQGGNLHPVKRSEGFYGDEEKLDRSLRTMAMLTRGSAQVPGRKLMFWISPGWPFLVGTQVDPSGRSLDTFFQWIVLMSNGLREARVTLFDIDPVRNSGSDLFHWNYYREYLKGVQKPNNASAANLALQVLAEQSGGGAINPTNKDLWQEIASNVANYDSDYSFVFNGPEAKHPDEYHALTVRVNNPELVVHTRNAYYAESK